MRGVGALALAATLAIAACSGGPAAATTVPSAAAPTGTFAPTSCATGMITAAGSTALQPLVDAAGKIYTAACPGSTITVNGGGSGTGGGSSTGTSTGTGISAYGPQFGSGTSTTGSTNPFQQGL